MEKPKYDLTIVVPFCNPKPHWAGAFIENVHAVDQLLPQTQIQFIVVNDGFETPDLLKMFGLLGETFLNISFISYPNNMGKGFALRTGVNAAQAPYIITTDADFPYVNNNIVEVYEQLLAGYDIVAGKRSGDYYKTVPLKRKLISKSCIMLNKMFLRLPDCDAQSGLKGFNSSGKRLYLYTKINRFLIDTEFLMLAFKRNLTVAIIGLQLKPGIRFSVMGSKVLYTEFKNLMSIVKKKRTDPGTHFKAYYVPTENLPDVRFRRV